MEGSSDDSHILIELLIFLCCVIVVLFSGRFVRWMDRKFTEAYPWLSNLIFYNHKTKKPIGKLPTEPGLTIIRVVAGIFAFFMAMVLLGNLFPD